MAGLARRSGRALRTTPPDRWVSSCLPIRLAVNSLSRARSSPAGGPSTRSSTARGGTNGSDTPSSDPSRSTTKPCICRATPTRRSSSTGHPTVTPLRRSPQPPRQLERAHTTKAADPPPGGARSLILRRSMTKCKIPIPKEDWTSEDVRGHAADVWSQKGHDSSRHHRPRLPRNRRLRFTGRRSASSMTPIDARVHFRRNRRSDEPIPTRSPVLRGRRLTVSELSHSWLHRQSRERRQDQPEDNDQIHQLIPTAAARGRNLLHHSTYHP